MPQKRLRSCTGSVLESSVMESPEVFEAKIALGPMCGATFSNSAFFQSMRSLIASITRSHSASSARCSS
jgi:hypothetical protein